MILEAMDVTDFKFFDDISSKEIGEEWIIYIYIHKMWFSKNKEGLIFFFNKLKIFTNNFV